MVLDLVSFIATYAASVGERANKDSYLKDLCTAASGDDGERE